MRCRVLTIPALLISSAIEGEVPPHSRSAGAHRGERCEITRQRVDGGRRDGALNLVANDAGRLEIATQHDDGEARRREFPRRYPADSMGGAGDDRDAAHGATGVSSG